VTRRAGGSVSLPLQRGFVGGSMGDDAVAAEGVLRPSAGCVTMPPPAQDLLCRTGQIATLAAKVSRPGQTTTNRAAFAEETGMPPRA
jgi:hypothetical protein